MEELIVTAEIGTNPQDPNPLLALTLATIAYATVPSKITNCLQTYAPDWSLVWVPDRSIEGMFAYIAYNGSSQYVVAIRGSELNFSWDAFDNWFLEDLNVFSQVPWMFPNSDQNPMISQGSSDGLTALTQLVQTTPAGQQTILQYLLATAIPGGASIGVVGHSLGGYMSTVLAPWLTYQIQQAGQAVPGLFPVITFAAPTAGNHAFATAFDSSFPNSWRYYNAMDIVPMASSTISNMGNLYSPSPEASQIERTFMFKIFNHTFHLTITLQEVMSFFGVALAPWYSQTNLGQGGVELNLRGELCSVTAKDPLEQWFEQAECQHSTASYFKYLGQPTGVTCK